jgi:hypothetical protein
MSVPTATVSGKRERSSRCKSDPSKEQRPLGSECCVATGDSGWEAYIAIALGCGIELRNDELFGAEIAVTNVLLQVNRQTTKAKSSKINAAATTKMVPDFLTYVRAGSRVRCEFSPAAFMDDARPN